MRNQQPASLLGVHYWFIIFLYSLEGTFKEHPFGTQIYSFREMNVLLRWCNDAELYFHQKETVVIDLITAVWQLKSITQNMVCAVLMAGRAILEAYFPSSKFKQLNSLDWLKIPGFQKRECLQAFWRGPETISGELIMYEDPWLCHLFPEVMLYSPPCAHPNFWTQ